MFILNKLIPIKNTKENNLQYANNRLNYLKWVCNHIKSDLISEIRDKKELDSFTDFKESIETEIKVLEYLTR